MFLYNFVKKHKIGKKTFISYFTGLSVILYFIICTFFGPKGLTEYFSLQSHIIQKQAVKKKLSSKAGNKQDMVDGMNLNSLDIDLLDEQARKTLGYVGKNEVVIYQKEKPTIDHKKKKK